ncbi:MAG: D-alanyl-D-alanine carboxypeptidase [Ruminococcus sp.]|nr:D-alanyl-D-alanine carboxypeptidase [Ruminococcus sp.]
MNIKILRKAFGILTAGALMSLYSIGALAYDFTPYAVNGGDREELTLFSEAAYMVDMDTGEVFIDRGADEERVPASLTKIVTALVVLEDLGGDEEVLKNTFLSAGEEAFYELYDSGAAVAGIMAYEEVSCYDLLAALLIPSACDAANVIAYGLYGSPEAFAERMDQVAGSLGMDHSHFTNAHGLWDDDHYSSCRDMAAACLYALETYPVFAELTSMADYTMSPTDMHQEGIYISNTNYMLDSYSGYYYPACKGIKTGTLDTAGRCLASYAVEDGRRFLTVTMGAPMEKTGEDYEKGSEDPYSVYGEPVVYHNLLDHIGLYDWALSSMEERTLISAGDSLTVVMVEGSADSAAVSLAAQESYSLLWPSDQLLPEPEKVIELNDEISAPIKKGQRLGTLKVSCAGEMGTEIPLVAMEDIDRAADTEVTSGPEEKAPLPESAEGEKEENDEKEKSSSPLPWVLGLCALTCVSAGAVSILREKRKSGK